MKKIKLSLTCLSVSLLLFSCGGKSDEASGNESTAAQDPKAFYDDVDLRVENCIASYDAFNEAVSSGDKNDVGITYDAMVKSFDAEKNQLANIDAATGGEDQTLSKNLKEAASNYVNVFVESGKKELLEIKNLSLEGKSSLDTEILDAELAYAEKTDAAKSPYIKLKKEFRTKYDLKNH